MNKRTFHTRPIVLGLAVVIIVMTIRVQRTADTAFTNTAQPTPVDNAYPEPDTVPTPAPTSDLSPEAQIALAFIAQREGLALDTLHIVTEFQRDAPLLGRTFQAVTVVDQRSGQFYPVLVDRDSGQVEDREAIADAEKRAHLAAYGKLQPALFEKLQQLQENDLVTVTIILANGPGQSSHERAARASAAVAAKYPEARAAVALNHQPMEVDDPVLADQIYKEYVALLEADIPLRKQALLSVLQAQGLSVRHNDALPTLTVAVPKQMVQGLANRPDVGALFLASNEVARPTLDN